MANAVIPSDFEFSSILWYLPARSILRDYLRAQNSDGLLQFYLAAQKFGERETAEPSSPEQRLAVARVLVADYAEDPKVSAILVTQNIDRLLRSSNSIEAHVFAACQAAALDAIQSEYHSFKEHPLFEKLRNELLSRLAIGAGFDIYADLQPQSSSAPISDARSLSYSVLEHEDEDRLLDPAPSPSRKPQRHISVDMRGQSVQLVQKTVDGRSASLAKQSSLGVPSALPTVSESKALESKSSDTSPVDKSSPSQRPSLDARAEKKYRLAFKDLLYNPMGLEMLHAFMAKEFCDENIQFHLAVERFRRTVYAPLEMAQQALKIYNTFIDEHAKQEVTIPSALRTDLQKLMRNPTFSMFDSIHRVVMKTIRSDVFRRFTASEAHAGYIKYIGEWVKESLKTNMVQRRALAVGSEKFTAQDKVMSLEDVVFDPEMLGAFVQFCTAEFSEENIIFWCAADEYSVAIKRQSDVDAAKLHGAQIYKRHIKEGSPYEVQVEVSERQKIADAVERDAFAADLFENTQRAVFEFMKNDSYKRFTESVDYQRVLEDRSAKKKRPASTARRRRSSFFGCTTCAH